MKSLDKAYETLMLEKPSPGVVVVTLNRPERFNAMTNTMFGELEDIALALSGEDDCRVVILTGAGKAFCAGYDLADADDLPGLGALGMLDQQERAARALLSVRSMRVPVIAAVNGAAAGGGLALALAADIRLAAPEAKFNAAFVRIGLSAGDPADARYVTDRPARDLRLERNCGAGHLRVRADAQPFLHLPSDPAELQVAPDVHVAVGVAVARRDGRPASINGQT